MFLVTNRLTVNEGWEEELERRFAQRAREIDDEPGFIALSVMRPVLRRRNRETGEMQETDAPRTFLIQTWWESEQAFWNWTRSESFKAAHRETPPEGMYAAPGQMEIHELVYGAGPAPE